MDRRRQMKIVASLDKPSATQFVSYAIGRFRPEAALQPGSYLPAKQTDFDACTSKKPKPFGFDIAYTSTSSSSKARYAHQENLVRKNL